MTLKSIRAWLRCSEATAAVEYALLAGGVSLVIVIAVILIGDDIQAVFDLIANALGSLTSG